MTCQHGECGCNSDDRNTVMERRQAAEQDKPAGRCGGHTVHETETGDQFEVGQRA